MIKIFDANDKDFTTAGNIIILPLKCKEFKKKSLNGWYIEVEIPIKYKEYIKKDKLCVIKTKSKLNPQAFRIGDNIQYTNKKIIFTANHVMFDSKDYFLVDVRPTNLNGMNALNYINERTDNISPFKMFSNVENVDTAYFIRKNLLEAWSIIEERWGGVFDADNWNINFLQKVGNDNGESIIYGKNMQSMEIYEDWSNVVTRLYPVGYDGLMLPEKYIESDVQYEKPYTRTIDFQTELEQEEQTEENLIEELRTNATNYLEENKYPKVSYTTKSDINNNMEIGDTIQVLHPLVSIKTEVLEYEYDSISKRITSLTFGNFTRDVKAKFDNIKNTINQISQAVSNQEVVINNQTSLINSLNKNGYVYIDDNEILILDKIPKETAENVWRFGLGGIGFSSNGYEGPFEIAITMDGQINAKFITTGTMSVSRIEGLANKISEYDTNLAEINLQLGNIQAKVSGIEEFTREIKGTKSIILENCIAGDLLELHIYGNNTVFNYLFPSDTLFPLDNLFPYGDSRIVVTDSSNNSKIYELGIMDTLRQNEDVCDEYVLKDGQAQIIRRINKDGTIKEIATIEELGEFKIALSNGNNKIEIKNYTAELSAKWAIKNDYSKIFTTKVETEASIELSREEINIELEKKTDNDKIIASINMSTEKNEDGSQMQLQADKISLKGKDIDLTGESVTISSTNFNVDEDGNMKCNNAIFNGGTLEYYSSDGQYLGKQSIGEYIDNISGQSKDVIALKLVDNGTAPGYVISMPDTAQIFECHKINKSELHGVGGTPGYCGHIIIKELLSVQNLRTNYISTTSPTDNSVVSIEDGLSVENNFFVEKDAIIKGTCFATEYGQYSVEEMKKNISETNLRALDIINQSILYEYNWKTENNTDKKHLGFIIGKGYKTPKEILTNDNKNINLYDMSSLNWKATQELLEIINKQNQEIEKLKEKINTFEDIIKNNKNT